MEYNKVKKLSGEEFRRLTGVKRAVFEDAMRIALHAEVLRETREAKRLRGGYKSRFGAEDRLLIMLEYWREYRPHFHMAQSRGISETHVRDMIRECEDVLIKSGRFTLPGRKALLKSDMQYEVVLIDATETPIERPKKSKDAGTPAKRNAIPKRRNSS